MPKKACCLRSWSVSGSFQAEIGKPGTQNPGPVQVFKLRFVPSRTQKNDVTMWRNRHICTKFRENRHIFGSTKNNFFETWQRHIEPAIWRFVTKMWRHMFSSPSLTQIQVQVLRKFRLEKTLKLVAGVWWCPEEHILDPEILGRVIPETGGLASIKQRRSAVLLDVANGTLHAGLHYVIVPPIGARHRFQRNFLRFFQIDIL